MEKIVILDSRLGQMYPSKTESVSAIDLVTFPLTRLQQVHKHTENFLIDAVAKRYLIGSMQSKRISG